MRQSGRRGRLGQNQSTSKALSSAKSIARCHVNVRFFVALPKQPQSRLMPRTLAATVATMNITISPVRIIVAPERSQPMTNAKPQRTSSHGR